MQDRIHLDEVYYFSNPGQNPDLDEPTVNHDI